jgi:hypothetical protein
MKYFAFYDNNKVVRQVLPVPDSADEASLSESLGMSCKETFKDESARGVFAGCECVYIPDRDMFVKPKPYDSWFLDTDKLEWVSSIEKPTDGQDYYWSEEKHQWKIVPKDLPNDADMEIIKTISSAEDYADKKDKLSAEAREWMENNYL